MYCATVQIWHHYAAFMTKWDLESFPVGDFPVGKIHLKSSATCNSYMESQCFSSSVDFSKSWFLDTTSEWYEQETTEWYLKQKFWSSFWFSVFWGFVFSEISVNFCIQKKKKWMEFFFQKHILFTTSDGFIVEITMFLVLGRYEKML